MLERGKTWKLQKCESIANKFMFPSRIDLGLNVYAEPKTTAEDHPLPIRLLR
jgi:hypothetical protein